VIKPNELKEGMDCVLKGKAGGTITGKVVRYPKRDGLYVKGKSESSKKGVTSASVPVDRIRQYGWRITS